MNGWKALSPEILRVSARWLRSVEEWVTGSTSLWTIECLLKFGLTHLKSITLRPYECTFQIWLQSSTSFQTLNTSWELWKMTYAEMFGTNWMIYLKQVFYIYHSIGTQHFCLVVVVAVLITWHSLNHVGDFWSFCVPYVFFSKKVKPLFQNVFDCFRFSANWLGRQVWIRLEASELCKSLSRIWQLSGSTKEKWCVVCLITQVNSLLYWNSTKNIEK